MLKDYFSEHGDVSLRIGTSMCIFKRPAVIWVFNQKFDNLKQLNFDRLFVHVYFRTVSIQRVQNIQWRFDSKYNIFIKQTNVSQVQFSINSIY